jgi:hypothetical protein
MLLLVEQIFGGDTQMYADLLGDSVICIGVPMPI